MKKNFNSILNTLFRNRASLRMTEEENISYSRQRLRFATREMKNEAFDKAVAGFLQEIRYPPIQDFKKGLEWFNVSEPLSFEKHLKGKLVILDFFTYCCINCMHILPDLKELEEKYPVEAGLVVIGVHSAKFENEKNSSNICAAVQRYNIRHPVVNDNFMDMWSACDVSCWPTLLLIGPQAKPIVMLSGEGHINELESYIKSSLKYYKRENLISNHKIPFKTAYRLLPPTKGPLLFPGKITTFLKQNNEILAVSDSGNNRILILTQTGDILHQIGNSKPGFKDGKFDECEFNNPQGLVFKNENLIYIADTDNHAIRMVDLSRNWVETVVGDGKQGDDYQGGKKGRNQRISSPWDLVLYGMYQGKENKHAIIIAMAGTHQIWALFLDDVKWWKNVEYSAGTCVAIAGSGREENRNNDYPHTAGFAQPSGLALAKKTQEIYIADSESSSVRRLSLIDGKVTHVVGGDRNPTNLFAFGDEDGRLYDAKLQHSLGLAMLDSNDVLFVADTYNHKIKKIDIRNNQIKSITIGERHDTIDGIPLKTFREPAGLCTSTKEPKLYVADTNNHCIKVIDLDSESNFMKINLLELKSSQNEKNQIDYHGQKLRKNPLKINPDGGKIIVRISLKFGKGLRLTDGAPQSWEVVLPNPAWSCVPTSGNLKNQDGDIDIIICVPKRFENNDVFAIFSLVTCTDTSCLPKNFAIEIPFEKTNTKDSWKSEYEVVVNLSPNPNEI